MSKKIPKSSSFILALIVLLGVRSSACGQEISAELLRKLKAATVYLKAENLPGLPQGTGFFIDQNLVLTNAQVMPLRDEKQSKTITVVVNSGLPSERELDAAMVAFDPAGDLSFFRILPKLGFTTKDFLPIGDSTLLRETQNVYLAGFPFGNSLTDSRNPETTIAPGTVSSFRKNNLGFVDAIQIDGNLVPGNSGGPVIDSSGRVVGVAQSMISATQIGFAIPSENVKLDIAGRIVQAEIREPIRNENKYSFQVTVRICDPYRNIRSVGADYWIGKGKAKRPQDARLKYPLYGAPGDGPRQSVKLSPDPQDATGQLWIASVSNFNVGPGEEFWVQAKCINKKGENLSVSCLDLTRSLLNAKRSSSIPNSTVPTSPNTSAAKSNSAKAPFNLRLGELKSPDLVQSVTPLALPTFEKLTVDDDGVTRISTTAEAHKLGEISQMAVSPSGDAVYMVFRDSSVVEKYDPADFSQRPKRLEVPKGTETIWCDSKRVVVGCRRDQDGKILFLDKELENILHEVRIPNLVPHMIVGRAPDDSIITLWRDAGKVVEHFSKTYAYLVDPTQPPRLVGKDEMDWCNFCMQNEKLLFQWFRGSPSGSLHLFDIASQTNLRMQSIPNLPGIRLHTDCFHAFGTFDGKDIVVSQTNEAGVMTSMLVSSNLRRVDLTFPGATFAEDPVQGHLIAISDFRNKNRDSVPEVLYVNRQSGKIVRKIVVEDLPLHPATLRIAKQMPHFAYVPGHELVIFVNSTIRRDDTELRVIRCGPLSERLQAATPALGKSPTMPAIPAPRSLEELSKSSSLHDQLTYRFAKLEPTVTIQPTAKADASKPLDARLENDKAGLPITIAKSQPEKFSLGDGKLIQVVADPSGEKLYAIFEEQSMVKVIDSGTITTIGEIQVPRYPVSLGFDGSKLVVACNESQSIAFVDTATGTLTASVKVRENKRLVPTLINRCAPDGSVVTLWEVDGPTGKETHVYLVKPDSAPFFVMKGDIQWCMFPSGPNTILTQTHFVGSPSGIVQLFKVASTVEPIPASRDAFGRKGFSLHNDFGLAFLSTDRSRVIVPASMFNHIKESFYVPTRTLVVSPDLTQIHAELQGSVIAELDSSDCYIAWRSTGRQYYDKGIDVLYISRSSGRVHRIIQVPQIEPEFHSPATSPRPRIAYVPGRELLIVRDKTTLNGEIQVVRCGPIADAAFVPSDPSIKSEYAPPTKVFIGKPVTFTPDFKLPAASKGPVTFRVAQGIPGVKIDPKLGTIVIDPSPAYQGSFDIEIEASVDGQNIKVLSWVLEVDLPPE